MSTTTNPNPSYRWSHPSEWLEYYISEVAERGDVETLAQIARELAANLDGDQIQDTYQPIMDDDGYFRDLNEPEDTDDAESESER